MNEPESSQRSSELCAYSPVHFRDMYPNHVRRNPYTPVPLGDLCAALSGISAVLHVASNSEARCTPAEPVH